MTYILQNPDYIAFSNTSILANGEFYDSGVVSLVGYTQVQTDVLSDKNGTILIQFCTDAGGTDVARTLTIPYVGGSGFQMFSAPAFTPYVKYRFTVTESGQSDFYFDTKLLTKALSPQVLGADAFISSTMASTLTRSIIVGKTQGGNYWNSVSSGTEGDLLVRVDEPTTAFGEVSVAQPEPVAQVDFVYGINSRLSSNTTANGTITSANNMLVVSTSANVASYAQYTSRRYMKYRPGQGAMGRFTALYTAGEASSNQYAGLATSTMSDAVMFGYNGTDFGIWHINGNNRTHITQTDWNIDKMDGTSTSNNKSGMLLDPTKGNVYQVKYQYLGFGSLSFFIENSFNGQFVPVHEIKYANANIVPSLDQPSLHLVWRAENDTNANNMVVKGASGALFLEGQKRYLGPRNSYNNNKTGITTETCLFMIKNSTFFNNKVNEALSTIRNISFGGNASGGAAAGITTLRIIRNPDIATGTPTWVTIDGTTADGGNTITSGTSTMSHDSGGVTTVTGNNVVYNAVVATGSGFTTDVTELDITILPGETLAFLGSATAAATIGIGVVWNEDI